MAPKRSRKVVSVKKVIQETVEVAVVENNNKNEINEDDITTSTVHEEQIIKTIAVQDKTLKTTLQQEEEDQNEAQTQKKNEQEKEAQTQKTSQQDEETQSQKDSQQVEPVPPVKNDDVSKKKAARKKMRKKRTRFDQVQGGTGREEYKRYVFRVLKQVHPGMGISAKAMTVVNNMMSDMFERLADESSKLAAYTSKITLTSREVQAAVRLVLPGDLGRHAVAEGAKAIANYMSSGGGGRESKSK